MTVRTIGKAIALLAAYGTAFAFAELIYVTYRYSNVRTIAVSKLSDLGDVFEGGTSSLKVEKPGIPQGGLRRGLRLCLEGCAKVVRPG